MVSLKWSHNIVFPMMYLLFQRFKQKLCMERSTCFTKVTDGFGWFAALVVFYSSRSIMDYSKKKKMEGVVGDILFLEKPLKFLGMLLYF